MLQRLADFGRYLIASNEQVPKKRSEEILSQVRYHQLDRIQGNSDRKTAPLEAL